MADPIEPTPIHDLPLARAVRTQHDLMICPECKGLPEEKPGGCTACNNTGRRRVLIPMSDSDGDCICVLSRMARPIAGIKALCPVCKGTRRVTSERWREVYPTLLRHQAEYCREEGDTQIIRQPLAVVLSMNGFGAYTDVLKEHRLYVEPAGEKDRYDVFAQDILRELGPHAHVRLRHARTLESLARVPGFPPLEAAVWRALPGQAALRLWEVRHDP